MNKRIIFFLIGILLISFAWYLWKRRDTKESFWQVLTDLLGDIIFFQWVAPLSIQAWSVLLGLIGFIVLVITIVAQLNL
ncbi:NADH:ubiquinone oxidoreductase subunit 6 (subunit J) [Priestia megaterium]|uniref:hypothetical protein n=1 Tax=Priestia megaterium TaxID=1404 RepID=UPI003398A9B6